MKKTEILEHQATTGPETVFNLNYGHCIIDNIKPNNRGSMTVYGRRVYHSIDENGTVTAYIAEGTSTWTLNQVEWVYANNLEHFIQRIAERRAATEKAEQKRAEQRKVARQAEADMQTILDRLGIGWSGAHFGSYYNGKCTLEMTPDALVALVAYINEHTQEVTA